MQTNYLRHIKADFTWLILFLSVVGPRACTLGAPPRFDDSFYAFFSKSMYLSISNGNGLPDFGGLFLYPLVSAWAFALPGNPLVWLRLIDIFVALVSGVLLLVLLKRESGDQTFALILGGIVLASLNIPQVIDAGYKNSIILASIPLLLSCLLVKQDIVSTSSRWFVVGGLVSLSILIREPFYLFSLFGFVTIWVSWGWVAAWRFAVGGAVAGLFVISLVVGLRGGGTELVLFYVQNSKVFASESDKLLRNFFNNGWNACILFWGPLSVTCMLCIKALRTCRGCGKSGIWGMRAWFWLGVALLPLAEPLTKFGFVYHFASTLFGCAALSAYLWRCTNLRLTKSSFINVLLALSLLCSYVGLSRSFARMPMTLDTFTACSTRLWPQKYDRVCGQLHAASLLRNHMPNGGTLCTSGLAFYLYCATGVFPPIEGEFDKRDVVRMGDLSLTFFFLEKDIDQMSNVLKRNPPDVLALAFTHPSAEHIHTYTEELTEAVRRTGLYDHVLTIPPDISKEQGWLGFEVYRKHEPKTDSANPM